MGVLHLSIKVALSSNKAVILVFKLNDKLKCREIIFLNNRLDNMYLLVTVATFEVTLTQALLCPLKDG